MSLKQSQCNPTLVRQMTPEYDEDEEKESDRIDPDLLEDKCYSLSCAQLELESLYEKHDLVFNQAKCLRQHIKDMRTEVLELMKANEIYHFVDKEGNIFKCKKKTLCPISHKKMAETLDEEAVNKYKRKNNEEHYVITMKKRKNTQN